MYVLPPRGLPSRLLTVPPVLHGTTIGDCAVKFAQWLEDHGMSIVGQDTDDENIVIFLTDEETDAVFREYFAEGSQKFLLQNGPPVKPDEEKDDG
jgi:hypothetical protein